MAKQKKQRAEPRIQMSVSKASCTFTWPTTRKCWLCGVTVPANTWHRCSKEGA